MVSGEAHALRAGRQPGDFMTVALDTPILTFVFPCLDEEQTLPACIRAVQQALAPTGHSYEIVVADNGSTDRSRELAEELGARVVPVAERGYGAALRGGIAAARAERVAFADADGSYRLEDIPQLLDKSLETDADMVIASRLRGEIEPGAMPPLHRYLGTPVLTFLINLLFRGKLSDCNSGFRLLKREAFEQWQIRSTGMEFASELLIKALKHRASIVEVPSGLRPDLRDRPPHLRTWRDGMRHLLFILSERPELFEWVGIVLFLVAAVLQAVAMRVGIQPVFGMNIFGHHTQALLIPVGCVGAQLYVFSCHVYATSGESAGASALTRRILNLDEAIVLVMLLGLAALGTIGVGWVVWQWRTQGFAHLDLLSVLLPLVHALCALGFVAIGLLGVHIMKKASRVR
jgi:glycosyltransferase involved in cell wall biosynthesis